MRTASSLELLESGHNLDLARTKQQETAATMERLQAQLAKTKIFAPIDGTIIERFAHAGQMIDPQSPLVTIADLTRTRNRGGSERV